MFALPQPNKNSIDQCVFNECHKPLGQESKDLGYLTCHNHRTCAHCDITLTPKEIQWCYDRYQDAIEKDPQGASMDLTHPRCSVLSHTSLLDDPTLSIKQSEYDYLNMIRLMVEPSLELSSVTNENNAMIQSQRLLSNAWSGDFDKAYAHLKMLEACVAQVSLLLAQDKKELHARANEREKVKSKRAAVEAKTSSRSPQKPATDEHEILLASFMEVNGIKHRATGLKYWKMRQKAIEGFCNIGLAVKDATAMVDKSTNYKALAQKEEGEGKK